MLYMCETAAAADNDDDDDDCRLIPWTHHFSQVCQTLMLRMRTRYHESFITIDDTKNV